MKKLSGVQMKALQEALLSAFPGTEALKRMLRIQLNADLEAIAGGNSLAVIVFNVIEWAEAQGRLEELIQGAYEANPGNPDLKRFAEEHLNLSKSPPASSDRSDTVTSSDAPLTAGASETPGQNATSSPTSGPSSFKGIKLVGLQKRLAILVEAYTATNEAIMTVLGPEEKMKLMLRLQNLEQEITLLEAEIEKTGKS